MPEATLRKLIQLAKRGRNNSRAGQTARQRTGFGQFLEKRRTEYREMLGTFDSPNNVVAGVKCVAIGKGKFLCADDVEALLREASVPRERCVDLGFASCAAHTRKVFTTSSRIAGRSVDGWITLGAPAKSAVILDPRFENRAGVATTRRTQTVRLRFICNCCRVNRASSERSPRKPPWVCLGATGNTSANLKPLPAFGRCNSSKADRHCPPVSTRENWRRGQHETTSEAKRFAGTARYTIEFDKPAGEANDWLLDLGKVCESARVRLNGHNVGALWCAPFKIQIGKLLQPGKNILEVEVTNLAANRMGP